MRHRYIVTYDICDPKRLRVVFRTMKGYGLHLQYSVFRCDLTDMALAGLKTELRNAIDFNEDKILFVNVGPSEGRGQEVFDTLGKADVSPDEPNDARIL